MADNHFPVSTNVFLELTQSMGSTETMYMKHSKIEGLLTVDTRKLARSLFEEHADLRNPGELGDSIVGSDGVIRTHKRMSERTVICLFGEISIKRLGYGARGHDSLFPKDAILNLPTDSYSHGVRKLVAEEVAKNPFNEVIHSVKKITGIVLPRTSVEMLAYKAAMDFDAFYLKGGTKKTLKDKENSSLLILTTDGKGIVMRKEDLREATRKRSEGAQHKLKKRQSKGEKANAKRMATVASVYDIDRFVRTPEQIIGEMQYADSTSRPRPVNKRVWASIEHSSEKVTVDIFDEALRRDPKKEKKWGCLIDGCPKQLKRIQSVTKNKDVSITIIMDIIHVIEYLWKAARVFYKEGDSKAENWVSDRLLLILQGKAVHVAAGIRRSATLRKISKTERIPVDKCSGYLLKNKHYLQYDLYLKEGFPIATGIIEGACRHLIKDRMDVTGARWSLKGAEAIVKLRSLRSSGDFESYWEFHEDQEYIRNHESLYADPSILNKLRKSEV